MADGFACTLASILGDEFCLLLIVSAGLGSRRNKLIAAHVHRAKQTSKDEVQEKDVCVIVEQ